MLSLLSKKMLMALSSVFVLLTFFFGYVIMFNLDDPKNLVDTSGIKGNVVDDCGEKAIELGFNKSEIKSIKLEKRHSLALKRTVVTDPMDLAVKTSILQNYCKKMELKSYCLGSECRTKKKDDSFQFKMVLTIK